ncbi:UPF0260 protein like [Actinidia chinensis var. chinensis]|uniref:UPF0260 protein like n=1 Tax=Actinidia chinensis var. chinensis TaxID=1590841 RepID=A0A2R6PWJ2_ACTCC|nr:UPF0260 protein like [Actinidia chinensis var. chinensis]
MLSLGILVIAFVLRCQMVQQKDEENGTLNKVKAEVAIFQPKRCLRWRSSFRKFMLPVGESVNPKHNSYVKWSFSSTYAHMLHFMKSSAISKRGTWHPNFRGCICRDGGF